MRLKAKFDGSSTGADRSARSTKTIGMRGEGRVGPEPSPAARNLALAHHVDRLTERGVIADYTQAAKMLGVSQPRMTHVMGLLLLAPAVQEAILLGQMAPKDKELRELARLPGWAAQKSFVRTTYF